MLTKLVMSFYSIYTYQIIVAYLKLYILCQLYHTKKKKPFRPGPCLASDPVMYHFFSHPRLLLTIHWDLLHPLTLW